ncbi:MAG: hypothetical protein AMJ84_12250 [Acidithiobacillales bacterium SM23_46]|nr:MAG: hypothetical protein AMJ84_12250 [Acidithiobacillales bacterium SM23_46]KPL27965.1 MAG: hypothetical protein AMJ72_05875 [Acidithiobacillales bacterium SM1_46]
MTGASVTAKRCLDGGDQEAATGTVTEKGNGQYNFAPTAADMNASVVGFLMLADGCIPREITIKTGELQAGQGAIRVDHNHGGADNLAYKTAGNIGIDNATVYAYLKTDYDAGNTAIAYVKAKTTTDVNGRWATPMMLDAGTYILYYFKQNAYGPDTQQITVS